MILSKNHFDKLKKRHYTWERHDVENRDLDIIWLDFFLPPNNLSPIQLFENYLDQEIIDMIVT